MQHMKTTTKQYKYWIPNNYYEPAMFALKIYHKEDSFNKAIDIAYHYFTSDPTKDYYISPTKLDRNKLARHLNKYIINS